MFFSALSKFPQSFLEAFLFFEECAAHKKEIKIRKLADIRELADLLVKKRYVGTNLASLL